MLFEVKDYTTRKISSPEVRKFMAAVLENVEPTFRVFIILGPYYSGYMINALEVVRILNRDFLQTTVHNMEADMAVYIFKRKFFFLYF